MPLKSVSLHQESVDACKSILEKQRTFAAVAAIVSHKTKLKISTLLGGIMKKFKSLLTGLLVAAGLTWMGVQTAGAADHTIQIVHNSNTADEDYDGAMVFKDFVESQSNGAIEVKIFPGSQLCGNARECIESLQDGVLEVYISTIGGFSSFYHELQVLDLPYMFRDDRTAECVFDGDYTRTLRKDVMARVDNVRLMVVSNTGGWRNFATVKTQIKGPNDVKGQKIRTIKSEIQIELVRLMKGNPTGIAWPEVYTSLATGVVEGTKNGITDIVGMKFHEHIKYITLDGHAYMAALWWMRDDFFKGLPPDLQRIVVDGFVHLRQVTRAFPKRRQIAAYDEFTKSGGKIYVPTPAQKKEFQNASQPMKDWFTKKFGADALNKLTKAISECEVSIDAEQKADMG